jgi:outer membrane murein-binding lipoprotein Lpp
MADGTDTGTQSGADAGGQSGAGTDSGTDATGTTDAGTQSGATGTDAGSTDSARDTELEQVRARMRAADQRAAKAEADLKAIREKDLPEVEKLKTQVAELTAAKEKAEEDLKATRLDAAFLRDNKYKWKNPGVALKLADLSAVDIDDDGKVSGLVKALDALAKEHPYLVEPADSGEGEGEGAKGSTGAPSNSGRGSDTKLDMKKMAARIPALRTRGLGN